MPPESLENLVANLNKMIEFGEIKKDKAKSNVDKLMASIIKKYQEKDNLGKVNEYLGKWLGLIGGRAFDPYRGNAVFKKLLKDSIDNFQLKT